MLRSSYVNSDDQWRWRMHVLAICDSRSSLAQALALVEHKLTVIYRSSTDELTAIKTLDNLDHFALIVLSPIFWRVPTNTPALARHFRNRFRGPMVSIGNHAEWKAMMKGAGCDHTLNDNAEAARFIYDLLFPPT